MIFKSITKCPTHNATIYFFFLNINVKYVLPEFNICKKIQKSFFDLKYRSKSNNLQSYPIFFIFNENIYFSK